MKNRILSFFLLAALAGTGVAAPVAPVMAEETLQLQEETPALQAGTVSYEDVKKAMDTVNGAVDNLKEFFPSGTYTVKDIFNAFSSVGTVLGIVNGSVTFLRLIGLIDDPTQTALSNIQYQLSAINEKLSEMDAKLDNITHRMEQIGAKGAFDARTIKAMELRQNWHAFNKDYMESGLDKLMTQYNAMLLDGWRAWMLNSSASARNKNGVDNRQIMIPYRNTNGSYELVCTGENGVPDDLGEEGRYLVIPAEMLPDSMSWNVEKYREDLEAYIKNKLLEADSSDGYAGLDNRNFPEFSPENAGDLDEDTAAAVAKDAVSVLTYRVGCAEVNASSGFPLEVLRQFQVYKSNLLANEDGIDALIKTICLTHAFEFETKDDLMDVCDQLILKTGVYSTFVTSVLGMSDSVTSDQKTEALSVFCDAIKGLEDKRKGCLTGADNYCYLTGTKVSVTNMRLTTTAQVNTDLDGSVDGYKSYTANAPEISFGSSSVNTSNLIGDSDMLLIDYTLRSNGMVMNKDFINDHLKGAGYSDQGKAVTSFQRDTDFSVDGNYTMRSYRVIGDWFPDSLINMNYRPGSATSDHYIYHRMSKGTLLNTGNGQLEYDRMLSGLAIYAESHWYWWDDESAVIGGPADHKSFESSKQTVCTRNIGVRTYDHNYRQSVVYNAVVSEPVSRSFYGGSSDTIASLQALNSELMLDSLKEDHTFDEGVVTKEPRCEEPGIKTFTATDGSGLQYEEEISPTGHEWDEGVVSTEPGCDTKGIRTYTCKHDDGHIYTECIDATGHEWGEWVVVTEATADKPGEKHRICRHDPGHIEKEEIPATGIKMTASDKKTAGSNMSQQVAQSVQGSVSAGKTTVVKAVSPSTGDSDNSFAWMITAIAAAGTAAAAVLIRKRKKA